MSGFSSHGIYAPRGDDAKCPELDNDECPLRDRCLRHLRPSAQYQWFSTFENMATDQCAGFLPVDAE